MPGSTTTDNPSLLIRLREDLLRSPTNDSTVLVLKEARQALLSSSDPRERVGIRHILAQYHSLHADFDLAHRILDEAGPETPVDEQIAASTAYTRATVFNRQRQLNDALVTLAPYRDIHLEDTDVELAARIHTLYASLLDSLGDTTEAYNEYRIAIELRERHGEPRGMAVVYYNFGESCLRRDEDDLALEFFIRAYDIEKGLGDHASLAQSACHVAVILARKNDRDEALRFADEAMMSARQANVPMIIAHVMANRASALQILGDESGREKALEDTLVYLREFPIDGVLGPVLGNLGSLYLSQGKFEKAEEYLQRALEMSSRDGYQYNEGFWLFCLGQLRSEQGRYPEAIEYLGQAVEILRSVKAHVYTLDAMHALAKAHSGAGSGIDAFDTLAEMMRTYALEHNSEMQARLNSDLPPFVGPPVMLVIKQRT
ncbi:MAG: tetratricopeptide repeat protein [Candidatus Kapabacteria bacterium]|nr:tetratricopeptide repeat protein [Candidatus Kapabacteria bacterium]